MKTKEPDKVIYNRSGLVVTREHVECPFDTVYEFFGVPAALSKKDVQKLAQALYEEVGRP